MTAEPVEDTALMARAAWLCHIGGLSQQAAAERMGITRARVNRLLAEARDCGLVSITIRPADTGLLELEAEIARRWGLEWCICTPALGLEGEVPGYAMRAVGMAAAVHLRGHLARVPDAVVGTGWGRTLDLMTRHMAGVSAPQARFVSVMGSLTSNSSYNPFEVVHTFARITGGEGFVLPVPFIADSIADRQVLLSQKTVQQTLTLARTASATYISIGELTESSLLRRQGMISADDVETLRQSGAVGDTNGIFFDATGAPVRHPLNARTLALDFDALRGAGVVALVAGHSKIQAAIGFLESSVARGLIVDGDTARRLLKTAGDHRTG